LNEVETMDCPAAHDNPTHTFDYAQDKPDFLKFQKGSILNQN